MAKTRHCWRFYIRNQESVASAIARKESEDLTATGVGVVDEYFALIGAGRYPEPPGGKRRLSETDHSIILLIVTYYDQLIIDLNSQNQMLTHLFRDAGLPQLIGFTAK